VHDRGFAAHAGVCAPGILRLLAPVRTRGGLVLELGCGTGLLTTELIAAGHRVIATDASPAILAIARERLGDAAEEISRLTLPHDELPQADAIVAVGHPLNYLRDADSVDRALIAMADALRPDGVIAFDVCDLELGRARRGAPTFGRAGPDWAIITEFSTPAVDRIVRDITTFLPNADLTWRRDSEHHENLLLDSSRIPVLLRARGISARLHASFGMETLPIVFSHRGRHRHGAQLSRRRSVLRPLARPTTVNIHTNPSCLADRAGSRESQLRRAERPPGSQHLLELGGQANCAVGRRHR
jgi:SAM-dependent methyltransferase